MDQNTADQVMNIRPKLSYVILCDAVGTAPDGRKTLYGLFTKILARKFPHVQPTLAIVTRWSYGTGGHAMMVQITDSDKKEIFKTPTPFNFVLNDPLTSVDIVLGIQNMQFSRPGTYWIQVSIDGQPQEDLTLFVEKMELPE